MPSAPGPIDARQEAERPAARREYESFDWYEAATLTLAANATFQEVITFSGRVGRVDVEISAGPLNLRFRNRGEAAGSSIRLTATGVHELRNVCEIVEIQDPAGGGTQVVTATGWHPLRHIDRRESRRGPTLSDVRPRDQAPPEQIELRY
jgi:hypothetical protein